MPRDIVPTSGGYRIVAIRTAGRGFLFFWLLLLVVVHGELSEDRLRFVMLLKTNGTDLQQFTSPSLAPPLHVALDRSIRKALPTLLLVRDCIRYRKSATAGILRVYSQPISGFLTIQ